MIQQFSGIKAEPRTTIQSLRANIAVSPDGTAVRDISLVVPAVGEMTGAGNISPQHALDFRMRVTVKASSNILSALGQKSDIAVPFTIAGTSADPSFRPDVKGAAQEKLREFSKDPSKAIDAAKGIMDLFRRPKQPAPEQK